MAAAADAGTNGRRAAVTATAASVRNLRDIMSSRWVSWLEDWEPGSWSPGRSLGWLLRRNGGQRGGQDECYQRLHVPAEHSPSSYPQSKPLGDKLSEHMPGRTRPDG
ncbi:hypothetical protein Aglo01_36020 [Actinokineospora globicatena]|nr:hypothetical protein Aglo01_36020 [Actinokineospora globicatena]